MIVEVEVNWKEAIFSKKESSKQYNWLPMNSKILLEREGVNIDEKLKQEVRTFLKINGKRVVSIGPPVLYAQRKNLEISSCKKAVFPYFCSKA